MKIDIDFSLMRRRFSELFSGSILFRAGVAGLLLILVFIIVFASVSVIRNTSIPSGAEEAMGPFRTELQKYDTALLQGKGAEAEKTLRRIEKRARSVEEWLSVLKRWRGLVREYPRYLPGYKNALNKALKEFPHSQPAAALALEASFLYGDDKEPRFISLENYAAAQARITNSEQGRFAALGLCFLVLAGTLDDPDKAVSVPEIDMFLAANLSRISSRVKADLMVDQILVRILNGDEQVTPLLINDLVAGVPQNRDFILLGAEYYYDYGPSINSAALFARLGDYESLAREADALVLANDIPAARNIWTVLVSPSDDPNTSVQRVSRETTLRCLYNLAASSPGETEARFWLERLFISQGFPEKTDSANLSQAEIFGLIRYARFFDSSRGMAILEGYDDPFVDLEALRRKLEIMPPDFWVPQLWYLLGRHPEAEALYRWSAVFFDRHRYDAESAQLFKLASIQQFEGAWLDLHLGLAMLREGRTDEGELLIKAAIGSDHAKNGVPSWIIYANLGRLYESRRSLAAALEHYEAAAALAGGNPAAVLLQLRLSRCYEALGRFQDSRNALEQALEMDPDNINARFELHRMNAIR